MFRTLEDLANATPKDYLEHVGDPNQTALHMLGKGQAMFPTHEGLNADAKMVGRDYLYVGPGSGLVVNFLIDQGERAFGLETSRRGIASAPDVVRNYCIWTKPWETSFPNKNFHVAFISAYLKEILNEEEWTETLKEVARISKYHEIYGKTKEN